MDHPQLVALMVAMQGMVTVDLVTPLNYLIFEVSIFVLLSRG